MSVLFAKGGVFLLLSIILSVTQDPMAWFFLKSINTLTQVLLLSPVLWGVSTVLKKRASLFEWVAYFFVNHCLLQEVWSSHKDHQMQKSMLERPQTSQMQAELVYRCSTDERSTQTQRHLHAWSKGSYVFHTCPDAHWTVYLPTCLHHLPSETCQR